MASPRRRLLAPSAVLPADSRPLALFALLALFAVSALPAAPGLRAMVATAASGAGGVEAPPRPQVKVRQEPIRQEPPGACAPDPEVPGSAAAIAGLTSALRFLPPAVACLPAAPGVPSPLAALGHVAGAAEPARAGDLHRYLRQLAQASDRVRVRVAGISEEGREILLVTVSEAHNLAEIDYFRDTSLRLADPRRTGRTEAERLAGLGKAAVYVVGGTRPGDLASPEMLTELAYRLAVSERPEIRAVRENALVLLTPVAEPDAYDRQIEWYRRHLQARAGLPWAELGPILAPPYAGRYGGALWASAGDTALALASTRAEAEVFFGLRPQIVEEVGAGPPLLTLAGAAGRGTGGTGSAGSAAAGAAESAMVGATGNAAAGGAGAPDGGVADLADGADPWPLLAAAVRDQLRSWGMPGVHDASAAEPAGGGAAMEPGARGEAEAGARPETTVTTAMPAMMAKPATTAMPAGGGATVGAEGEDRPDPSGFHAGSAVQAGSAVLGLARDHLSAGGMVAVFGNGTAGTFERQVGELEAEGAAGAAGGAGAGPGAAAGGAGAAGGRPRAAGAAGGGTAARPGAGRPDSLPGAHAPRPGESGRGKAAVRLAAAGWPAGGRTAWSLRDSVNYGETATLAALGWAAAHRRELLLGAWQRGRRAWEAAGSAAPYAWILPARQPDPGRLAALVRRLLAQRIEVDRLSADLAAGGRRYQAGSYVVRLDQPYREAALRYLAGAGADAVGGPEPAAAGDVRPVPWTYLYNVEGAPIGDRAVLDAPMTEIAAPDPLAGGIDEGDEGAAPAPGTPGAATGTVGEPGAGAARAEGTAPAPAAGGAPRTADDEVFLLRDTGQVSLLSVRLALGSYQIDAAETAFRSGGVSYPPGSWIVQAPRARVAEVAAALGLRFRASAALPDVARHVVHLPRLALLHGWTGTEPSAWVRRALDQEHLPYTLISGDDLRAGDLRERFDLVLLAGAGGGADWRRELHGRGARWSPLAYTRTPEFPSHGVPDGTPDATAGLGGEPVTGGVDGPAAGSPSGPGSGAPADPGSGGADGEAAQPAGATVAGEGSAAGASANPARGLAAAGADAEPGLLALRRFVAGGGVLVTLGGSSALAAGTGLAPGLSVEEERVQGPEPWRSTDGEPVLGLEMGSSTQPTQGLVPVPPGDRPRAGERLAGSPMVPGAKAAPEPSTPGVETAVELRAHFSWPDHPLAYGYPVVTQVLRRGGPLLILAPAARGRAVLLFGAGWSAAGGGSGPGTAPSLGERQAPGAPGIEEEDIGGPAARPGQPLNASGASGASGAAGSQAGEEDASGAPSGGEGAVAGPAAEEGVGRGAAGADHALAVLPRPRPLGETDGRLVLGGNGSAAGAAALEGRPAVVDLALGRGHVVAFAFDPFDPGGGPADHRLVYNLLLNWHALPAR